MTLKDQFTTSGQSNQTVFIMLIN